MIVAALRGALSDRARDGRVHVVSELVSGDAPSTKSALAALKAATANEKVLVVLGRDEDLAWLSLRNAPSVHALAVDQLNAYDVLVNDDIIFTSAALEAFVAGPVAGKSVKAVGRESEAAAASPVAATSEPSVDAASDEPSNDEPSSDEPSNDELSVSTVESSAEPTNAELAAVADVASTLGGRTDTADEEAEEDPK
jgi:large subunit ribosomal protein L4